MQGTEQYHQEYHLEECNEEVGGGECQAENPGYCRAGALQDGNPEGIEAATDPVVGILIILSDVVVADVSAKVHGESDTHDEVDEGHAVETHSPPSHVAYDADLDRHY